jgi:hypothetical protein
MTMPMMVMVAVMNVGVAVTLVAMTSMPALVGMSAVTVPAVFMATMPMAVSVPTVPMTTMSVTMSC